MIIGGMTQFHATAQGMPDHIKRYLMTLSRKFIWGSDSPPPLPMSLLNSPINSGGRNIINIKFRNKAIHIMKLRKLYLSPPNRPVAADAVIAIIKACLPKQLHDLE